jgi:SAM-dependent methyltransferase
MPYPIITQQIPQERRAEINEKILFSIDTGRELVPKETIYNCYTGIGGLHGLKQSDFPNYHEYAKAKRELEMGQFFTPHEICRQMVEMLAVEPSERVLDMCCGIGNFFNHLPNPFNAVGFDVEANSVKVAKHLYPDAAVEVRDIRRYEPEERFDIIIGNPPFNLDWNGTLSQYCYFGKAYRALNPAGLLLVIVPQSFLESDFWDKTQVSGVNRNFSFIGQSKLPSNAFASVGVDKFDTKIMAFMRESGNIDMQPYSAADFSTPEELVQKIAAAREITKSVRLQLQRETDTLLTAEDKAFEYRLQKYLYELKTHRHLREHYGKALALVGKFRNQKSPAGCSNEEYEKWQKSKLTYPKVLAVIRRYIKTQNIVPHRETALIKTKYGFKIRNYHSRLGGIDKGYVPLYDLVANGASLPVMEKMTPKNRRQYAMAKKHIARKKREYQRQSLMYATMEHIPALDKHIDVLTFINKDLESCRFTDLQKQDMGVIFQKHYPFLNWQQGSGKTAVAFHYGKYLLDKKAVRNVIVLAPSNAINLTWESF